MKPVIGVPTEVLFKSWQEILDSGQFTEGKYTRLFEQEASDLHTLRSVAVSSAGAGLLAVLSCYEKGTWIVPNNTFPATVLAVKQAGHDVVLADCSRKDFSLSLKAVQAVFTNPVRGVVLTHVGGTIAREYEAIAGFCFKNGLALVEDAAHAYGAKSASGYRAGTLGSAAVFSFYPTKAVPVGEGGLVVTRDASMELQVSQFRNYGKFRDNHQDHTIRYTGKGLNLRMDEWSAAVAYHQTRRLNEILELRAQDAEALRRVLPPMVEPNGVSNWYKYIVPSESEFQRTTGKVYARSDQCDGALGMQGSFPDCEWVSENHRCLPIGEGVYRGKSTAEIERYLLGGDL